MAKTSSPSFQNPGFDDARLGEASAWGDGLQGTVAELMPGWRVYSGGEELSLMTLDYTPLKCCGGLMSVERSQLFGDAYTVEGKCGFVWHFSFPGRFELAQIGDLRLDAKRIRFKTQTKSPFDFGATQCAGIYEPQSQGLQELLWFPIDALSQVPQTLPMFPGAAPQMGQNPSPPPRRPSELRVVPKWLAAIFLSLGLDSLHLESPCGQASLFSVSGIAQREAGRQAARSGQNLEFVPIQPGPERASLNTTVSRAAPSALSASEPPNPAAFWSFQPLNHPVPPPVRRWDWVRNPIDQFILAKLEAAGIEPAPEARRIHLIRRVAFDLTGLAPSLEEIEQFVQDPAPDAFDRLVDRYLQSPQYGERWAQHWLDAVRYAETEGFEYDRLIPGAWRFRDYVIDAFNQDKPYDRFLKEQIAGDETDSSNLDALIAAGFHRLGPVRRNAGNQDVASSRNEVLTERTDIIGTAMMGLTLGCARCHDHKFDPILQKDYYQFQAFLAASEEHNVALAAEAEQAAWSSKTNEIARLINERRTAAKNASLPDKPRILEEIKQLEAALPPPLPSIPTIRNLPAPTPIHVLKRGVWELKGLPVGMRPPAFLVPAETPELPLDTPKPRLALAAWLTAPNHPLTPRVWMNRVWLHHFGQGLVNTPNDFGHNGSRPSHPELLDFLAHSLIEQNWRLKPLHRLILLSSAYRQSITPNPSSHAQAIRLDPDNRWLWRFNPRRLSAEEIRDALLQAAGRLNPRMGGESVVIPVDSDLVAQLYKPSQWTISPDPAEFDRRSIYLLAKRNLRLPFLEVFDQPTLQASCGQRESSTHPPQALELLNGAFAQSMASAFASRLLREAGPRPAGQIELAFRLATGRPPTPAQRELAQDFLAAQPLTEFTLSLFSLNSFLYVQ